MKPFLLTLFVVPLVIASVAKAEPPGLEVSVALPPAITGTSSGCTVKSPRAALSFGNPAAVETDTMTCGNCSDNVCEGVPFNTVCQGGLHIKKCLWVYGDLCPMDKKPDCICWSGPLP